MKKKLNKLYVGFMMFSNKGQRWGTTRQVFGMNPKEARRKLMKKWRFEDNDLTIRLQRVDSRYKKRKPEWINVR